MIRAVTSSATANTSRAFLRASTNNRSINGLGVVDDKLLLQRNTAAVATTTTTNNNNNNITRYAGPSISIRSFRTSSLQQHRDITTHSGSSPAAAESMNRHNDHYYFFISSHHSRHRSFHSTSYTCASLQTKEYDDELPSNLRFDRRSSFAPKQKPLLVVPPDAAHSTIPTNERSDTDDDKHDDHKAGDIDDYIEEDDYDEEYDDDYDELMDVAKLSSTVGSVRPVIPLPDRLHQDILHGPDGSKSGTIWLDESVFGVDPIRIDLIKQSVDYIRNKIRGRRKAKTKTISEVSGSGRKVRRQKGTGQARAGHSRPAHWRGGAKAHGPKNTVDYGNIKMNKRAKALAMRSTLSQKVKEGNLILVDHLQLPSHKTKDWAKTLEEAYGISKDDDGSSALILDHYLEPNEEGKNGEQQRSSSHASYHGVPINLWVASSNIFKVKVANQRFANVYDILKKEKLIITLSALEQMENRWKDA